MLTHPPIWPDRPAIPPKENLKNKACSQTADEPQKGNKYTYSRQSGGTRPPQYRQKRSRYKYRRIRGTMGVPWYRQKGSQYWHTRICCTMGVPALPRMCERRRDLYIARSTQGMRRTISYKGVRSPSFSVPMVPHLCKFAEPPGPRAAESKMMN